MNTQLIQKAEIALIETNQAIAREMRFAPDLQRTDFLAKMEAHAIKLQNIINAKNN